MTPSASIWRGLRPMTIGMLLLAAAGLSLGQITPDQQIASVTADGAYDTRKCHDAIAERGAHAVIRKDGCEFCTQCGHVGACG